MPDRVGSYAIREEIGRGSFAVVYRGDKVVSRGLPPRQTIASARNRCSADHLTPQPT